MNAFVQLTSWDETSASVKEELFQNFPNLKELCRVGEGVLCNLDHPKPQYRLGFVFPVEDLRSHRKETIIYYPVKKSFVHIFKTVKATPVTETTSFTPTKRGNMKIVETADGQFGINFTLVK